MCIRDSYLCICHPFARLLTLDRAKLLIGLLALVAASLGACVAMFFGVYEPRRVSDGGAAAPNTTTTTTLPPSSSVVGALATSLDDDFTGGTTAAAAAAAPADSGFVNTGECHENDLVLSHGFQWYYQKLYTFMYPACLLAVVVLYVMIYRSVLRRRYRRQREKRKTLALVRTAQQAEDRQRAVDTPSPDGGRAAVAMLELTVDMKTGNEGVSAFDDSTLTTDINGCITLLPVSKSQLSTGCVNPWIGRWVGSKKLDPNSWSVGVCSLELMLTKRLLDTTQRMIIVRSKSDCSVT